MPPAAVILVFQRAKGGKEKNGWDSPIPVLDLLKLYPTSRGTIDSYFLRKNIGKSRIFQSSYLPPLIP